jgi:speckle-type POZ protein
MKIEWGFERLISLEALIDSCNGYLVKDRCIFGAEVFVIGNSPKRECISMVVNEPPPPPTKCSFTWKFDNFLPTISTRYSSKTFTFGDREWYLHSLLTITIILHS